MREQRTHAVARDAAYYEDRARGLLEVLPDGAPSTIRQVRTWHPAFADRSDEEIRLARFGIDVEDELYRSTPAGWAEHAGATDVASFLRAL